MKSFSAQLKSFPIATNLFHRLLPLILAILILLLSLGSTFILWRSSKEQAQAVLKKDFDSQVAQQAQSIEERMATYEQVARGTQAFILSSEKVDRKEFKLFVQLLGLEEKFPGIQGIAYVKAIPPSDLKQHIAEIHAEGFPDYTVHPSGEREFYSSIIQIEPATGMNRRAIGYDMLSNPTRRLAMERARDTGQASASGKVTLIQESGKDSQPGLVMYFPVYKVGQPLETVEERRASLVAWVGTPFRMNDLMAGLGGDRSRDLILSIYDGNTPSENALLYHSLHGTPLQASFSPSFFSTKDITVGGRIWTLIMQSSPYFESRLETGKATLIAWLGTGASILFALLVWNLASGRRRALSLANSMTYQLKESEFRWKYALEGAGDGVWDLNLETGHMIYSRRWKEMLGYSDSDIPNELSEWERLLHPEDKPQAMAAANAYFSGKQRVYSSEFRMRCKDGSWKWIHARGAPVSYKPDGSVLRTIGTHTDITARKEAERLELEKTQALNEARDSLRHAQKLEAVGKLTGGVAHDFNNVLQIMAGNIQMLQFKLDPEPEVEARLTSMLSAVEKGSKLSSQLLAFARRQPLQPQVLNLHDVIQNLDDLLHRALGESVRLQVSTADGLWNICVDPSQLENVIINLVINARDAMPKGGLLRICLENAVLGDESALNQHNLSKELPAGEYVLLRISDTGTGMSPDIMDQAFEPFFTTKPAGEGTGLGLSMAYGFVKQSGGDINMESVMGKGTSINIYLPRSHRVVAPPVVQPIDSISGGDETILVVEDDLEVQAAVTSMLKSLGYQVIQAENAHRALQIIDSGIKPDLLFTDVVMPGLISAPELAQEAKKRYPDLAIMFTSGYTRNALISGGRLEEGVQLLSKPYRREDLARRVRAIFDRNNAGQ